MKPFSIKYIGSAQACAPYVPFAKNKVKNVVEKERKSKSLHSRTYTFSNGVYIKCVATIREFSILIQASLGGLIFIGKNDTDSTVRQFQTDGFTHTEYPNTLPSKLSPYLAPFPTVPDDAGDPIPKYDWRDDNYTVFAGVGMRYAIPWYEKSGPEYLTKYFGYCPAGETKPTVCDKSGAVLAQGVTGSKSSGACVVDGYCIGISLRGEIRAWLLDDPDTIITQQISLPSWIGTEITLETYAGSGIYIKGYHGWLDGISGIEWKINKAGTRAVGLAYEIMNYGTGNSSTGGVIGSGDVSGQAHYWRTSPHIIVVNLNMTTNLGLNFAPTVLDGGENLGICGVDWYELDNLPNVLTYTFLNYYESEPADRRYYQLQFINYDFDTETTTIHDSFNIQVRSYTEWDTVFATWKSKYYGKVTGIDLRYHTYSYRGTESDTDANDISYARGFDTYKYKDQIGNSSTTDSYFNLQEGVDTSWIGISNLFTYFDCRHSSVQYAVYSEGSSCAAMENNKKRFAFMNETVNNTGEFYDIIQRDDIQTTHEDVFGSFGYEQDTDIDGKVNNVFHFLGVFT